jgi:hypothetical protein
LKLFFFHVRLSSVCLVWLDFCDGLGSEIQPKSERRPGVQDVDDEEVADSTGISDREASDVRTNRFRFNSKKIFKILNLISFIFLIF